MRLVVWLYLFTDLIELLGYSCSRIFPTCVCSQHYYGGGILAEPGGDNWQVFPRTTWDEARIRWNATHSDHIGERPLVHCVALAREPSLPRCPLQGSSLQATDRITKHKPFLHRLIKDFWTLYNRIAPKTFRVIPVELTVAYIQHSMERIVIQLVR